MAGRKPIESARQIKARVQTILRATDKDVAQNSEKNRLIDMFESMKDTGELQELLLSALLWKLRQDEGRAVLTYTVSEGGQLHLPQQSPKHLEYQHQHQAPSAPTTNNVAESREPAIQVMAVDNPLPSPGQDSNLARDEGAEAELESRGYGDSPSTIIESVVRGIESDSVNDGPSYTAPTPTARRKLGGNLLGAMG